MKMKKRHMYDNSGWMRVDLTSKTPSKKTEKIKGVKNKHRSKEAGGGDKKKSREERSSEQMGLEAKGAFFGVSLFSLLFFLPASSFSFLYWFSFRISCLYIPQLGKCLMPSTIFDLSKRWMIERSFSLN